ncbi:MAG: hypothetical protein DWQ34_17455 [Planctomycetota bacterium]|nr:MAG: hypothetical protein DWQ34_17455 [Planctomycetota bacterium]REK28025.1 MAG: hypothetical protein DWQ41_06330 [Planctomycetota bacterium]REK37552.1 MAG: hypothetical protein DWQ45_06015 [Planctomycetota bacterium]
MEGLGEITLDDLREDRRTMDLWQRAVGSGLVGRGDRLNFFAAAEHALRVGTSNPAGLFVWLLANRRWDYITQGDEDAACRRLQQVDESKVPLELNLGTDRSQAKQGPRRGKDTSAGLAHFVAAIERCLAA